MADDSTMDQVAGKAKEFVGKIAGDKDLEAEGRVQEFEGKVKDAAEDVAATIKAGVDRLTGKNE